MKCRKFARAGRATSYLALRNARDCAQCLHCAVVMSNASLRSSNQNHQHKKHTQRKDDYIDALSAKRIRYDLEATLPHLGFTLEEKPTLQFSYEVPYLIANFKKPHTITENLMKPCAEKMGEIMMDQG